jgi:hypothetical protein
MSFQPRPPVHHGPPRARAGAGDQFFALGVAAMGLLLAGALLVAGGGAGWPAGLGSGAHASPTPVARSTPGPDATVEPAAVGTTSPPAATPGASAAPSGGASPSPSPEPFGMDLYREGVFVHEVDRESCVAAAAQNMLNVIRLTEEGRTPDTSEATQRALYERIVELTTWEDSHNGGTGPGGWAAVLTEMGYPYEVRTYPSRLAAVRAAASALRATGRPVGILAWAGVHSWVMTGFRATADPAAARMFTVTAASILDPWYPWVSTRWPRSEAPNVPRDMADLMANVLPWKLASGPYEGRDGQFLLVVPLQP